MTFLFNFLSLLCELLILAILIRVMISWFSPSPTNTLVIILYKVTEPVLAPLRRIIPRAGRIDLTPLVAFLLLQLILLFIP
ncbi:YggT family protein [Chloroflexota bacterium]